MLQYLSGVRRDPALLGAGKWAYRVLVSSASIIRRRSDKAFTFVGRVLHALERNDATTRRLDAILAKLQSCSASPSSQTRAKTFAAFSFALFSSRRYACRSGGNAALTIDILLCFRHQHFTVGHCIRPADRSSICRTCTGLHRPPLAVATFRALSCPAMAFRLVWPAAWISRMIGRMLAPN
jgi:hypothetical protein